MGNVKDIDEEVSSEFSATSNICCDSELEELMFIQPHMHSPKEKQNTYSKNVNLKHGCFWTFSSKLMLLAMAIS